MFTTQKLSAGLVHDKVPADMKKVILANKKLLAAWEDITPLARNEWICWITTVKRQETRDLHIRRMTKELPAGKRRPCCWMGCIHRTDKVLKIQSYKR